MAYEYRPDLLTPYLALDQGEKIQAECMLEPFPYFVFDRGADIRTQTSGSTVTVASVLRHAYVLAPSGLLMCRLTICHTDC